MSLSGCLQAINKFGQLFPYSIGSRRVPEHLRAQGPVVIDSNRRAKPAAEPVGDLANPEVREWRIENNPDAVLKAVKDLARAFDGTEDGVSPEIEAGIAEANYAIYRYFLHPSEKYRSHEHAGIGGRGGDRPRNWFRERDGIVLLRNSYQEEWLWSYNGKEMFHNASVIGKFFPKGNSDDTQAVIYLRHNEKNELVLGVVIPKRQEAHELFPAIKTMFPKDSEVGQPRTWAKWHEPNFKGNDTEILEAAVAQLARQYGSTNPWNKGALFSNAREREMKTAAWMHYLNLYMNPKDTLTQRIIARIQKDKLIIQNQADVQAVLESVMGWKEEKAKWRLNLQRTLFKNEDHEDFHTTPFTAEMKIGTKIKLKIESEWRGGYRIDREGDVKIDGWLVLGNPQEPMKVTVSPEDTAGTPPTQAELDAALGHFVTAFGNARRSGR